jgi:copper(I)-binding protein
MTNQNVAPSRRFLLAGLAGLCLPPSITRAHAYAAGDIHVDHPVITPTRGRSRVHAGYLSVINRGRRADRLLSAASPRAGRVELHTHVRDGAMMRMRQVQGGVAIPAGQTVRFQPGGLHLMFFDVAGPIVEGDAVPATLRFERAGAVEVVALAETPGPGSGHGHGH